MPTPLSHARWLYSVGAVTALLLSQLTPLAIGHKPHEIAFVVLAACCAGICGFLLGAREDQLRSLGAVDPVTGLFNRAHFELSFKREVARANRSGHTMALLVVDLDGLKTINDRNGHRVGDQAIERVAAVLRHTCRSTDLASRWGGDEFAVLAPDVSEADARALAERIKRLVAEKPFHQELLASVSIGLSVVKPHEVTTPDAVFAAADRALYDAKALGKGEVRSAAEGPHGVGPPSPRRRVSSEWNISVPMLPHPIQARRRRSTSHPDLGAGGTTHGQRTNRRH